MTTAHSLGAFRGCDAHEQHHGINYTAVTEAHGPDAVAAMIAAGERAGTLCPDAPWMALAEQHAAGRISGQVECYATLDIRNEDGDIIGDRCIPTRVALAWWVHAVELRVDMSDCPVDTPEAHAVTYAVADLWFDGRHAEAIELQMGLLAGGAR